MDLEDTNGEGSDAEQSETVQSNLSLDPCLNSRHSSCQGNRELGDKRYDFDVQYVLQCY